MKQASKIFEQDPEWQKAIDEGERALKELSKAMEQQYYTVKQLDAALDISNAASMNGYRSLNGRDTRSQFLNWAVEFEGKQYEPSDRVNQIRVFAEQKMLVEVEAGRSGFREGKMSTWYVDRVSKDSKLDFDPTTPENYLQVMRSESLQAKHQVDINEAFEKQILKVGDKLEEKGWRGYSNFLVSENPLSMGDESRQIGVYFKPQRIEGTGNVLGGSWHLSQLNSASKIWEDIETIPDGLNRTPEYVADRIMAIRNKQLNMVSAHNAVKLLEGKVNHVDVADSNYSKAISGPILGRTGMHVVQIDATEKRAVIYKATDLNRVPEKDEVVNIAFQNGKGKVSDKEISRKGNER
jgi:hypothetical protein